MRIFRDLKKLLKLKFEENTDIIIQNPLDILYF